MLSEAKDTSELMVDLGYASLFFGDTRMADEVHELEERLTELVHEMREVCVLAARVSTKLHLGTLGEKGASWRAAVNDVMLVYMYAIPVFVFLGLTSTVVAQVLNKASPGIVEMLAVSLIAGFLATTAAVIVGFYSAVATHRFGLDPDNHSIPLVTSSLDLLGALSLILAIVILGLA